MYKLFFNKYKLNPFFRVRFSDQIICDLLLEKSTVVLSSPKYLQFFSKIDRPLSRRKLIKIIMDVFVLSINNANEIFEELIQNKLIVKESYKNHLLKPIDHWIKRGWLEALIFHLKSKDLDYMDDNAQNTLDFKNNLVGDMIRTETFPPIWKEVKYISQIELPIQRLTLDSLGVKEALLNRRSNEPMRKQQISLQELSDILFYSNEELRKKRAVIEERYKSNPAIIFDSSFSAFETYMLIFNVDDLVPGIYHYDAAKHKLSLIKSGNFREELIKMVIGQGHPRKAACAFVLTATWGRYMYRYRHPRAYRNLFINLGEFAQKYLVIASALKLSTFLTPALNDKFADNLLGLNGYEEAPLYVIAVG